MTSDTKIFAAGPVAVPTELPNVDLYVVWHFIKTGSSVILESEVATRTDISITIRAGDVNATYWYWVHRGDNLLPGLYARWNCARESPPHKITASVGDRMKALASNLCNNFPDLECSGHLRIPDGDLTDLLAGWQSYGLGLAGE